MLDFSFGGKGESSDSTPSEIIMAFVDPLPHELTTIFTKLTCQICKKKKEKKAVKLKNALNTSVKLYLQDSKLQFRCHTSNAYMASFPAECAKAIETLGALCMFFIFNARCFTSWTICNIRH